MGLQELLEKKKRKTEAEGPETCVDPTDNFIPSSNQMAKNEKEKFRNRNQVEFLYNEPELPDRQERPEDCIPDLPENQKAREFLKKAPTKGLFLPLGKEVKVMQCWRCKAYGHRAADKECPLFLSGRETNEKSNRDRYDPMSRFEETDFDQEATDESQRILAIERDISQRKERLSQLLAQKKDYQNQKKEKKAKKEKKPKKEKKDKKGKEERKEKENKKEKRKEK